MAQSHSHKSSFRNSLNFVKLSLSVFYCSFIIWGAFRGDFIQRKVFVDVNSEVQLGHVTIDKMVTVFEFGGFSLMLFCCSSFETGNKVARLCVISGNPETFYSLVCLCLCGFCKLSYWCEIFQFPPPAKDINMFIFSEEWIILFSHIFGLSSPQRTS